MKCCFYMSDYCFTMSHHVIRFVYLPLPTVYSQACCMEWSMLGDAENRKISAWPPPLFSFPFVSVSIITLLTSTLSYPVPLNTEHGVSAPMSWDEIYHSNLKVEGKGKNSWHTASLPSCVAAAKGGDLTLAEWMISWTSPPPPTNGVAVWSRRGEDHLKKIIIHILCDVLNLRIGDFRT